MGSNERAMFAMDLRNIKWDEMYVLDSCELQFEFFQKTIMNLVDNHFPWKTVTRDTNDRPWINDTFRYLVRRRQRAHKCQSDDYYIYRNKVNRMSGKLRFIFYKNTVEELKDSNPRKWWQGMRQLMGDTPTSSSGPMQDLATSLCDGDMQDLVDKINVFFSSLCEKMPPLQENNKYSRIECDVVPDCYIIHIENVECQLSSLRTNKAAGPDQIPTWVLKHFAPILAGPVAAIWNSSIHEGFLPEVWKSAYLAPLPKKTPAAAIEKDIRSISLTPILCKELEIYPVRWLWQCITNFIDPRQFGTVKGSSTVHALVEMLHHCFTATYFVT